MKALLHIIVLLNLGVNAFAGQGQWEKKESQGLIYFQYLPSVDTGKKFSLMLALHGCGQQAQDFAQYGNWQEAAEQFSTVVIVPQVPNGGVHMGCWDYYGSDHDTQNRHNRYLVQLLEALLKNPNLKMNPKKIFVSGLSSGAGQAAVLACLRPDLIAGVGLNSSPAIPSDAQDLSNPPEVTEMVQLCSKISGPYVKYLKAQKVSILMGDQDYIVSPEHGKTLYQAFKILTGAQYEEAFDLSTLHGNNLRGEGVQAFNSKNRGQVSLIINHGIGHNWAAGGGKPGGAFITQNSINYPLYLLEFFVNSN